MDTRTVIEAYLDALLAADIDRLLATFAEDAVIIGPGGPITTRPELAAGCRRLLDGLFAPGTYEFAVDSITVEGELGLLIWRARCSGTNIPFAADTYVVRGGRIVSKTFAMMLEPV